MKPTIEELEATLNLFKNAVKILDVKSDKPAVLSLNDCNAVCFALTQAIAIEKGESVIVPREPTETMLDATGDIVVGFDGFDGEFGDYNIYCDYRVAEDVYKAMINAAQEGAKDE